MRGAGPGSERSHPVDARPWASDGVRRQPHRRMELRYALEGEGYRGLPPTLLSALPEYLFLQTFAGFSAHPLPRAGSGLRAHPRGVLSDRFRIVEARCTEVCVIALARLGAAGAADAAKELGRSGRVADVLQLPRMLPSFCLPVSMALPPGGPEEQIGQLRITSTMTKNSRACLHPKEIATTLSSTIIPRPSLSQQPS